MSAPPIAGGAGAGAPAGPFASRLLAWWRRHGRHDLPWQRPRTPYRVWVSEIMLQQTQVATVLGYFARFVARFPDPRALADASEDEVLGLWTGLGYYARGRNLHRAAQQLCTRHAGELPADLAALQALAGIGRSTAGAILALGFDQRAAILDGNVKRVLARHRAVEGWPGAPAVQRDLWRHAEALTPPDHAAAYTQAIMDLGATLCTARRPDCVRCPVVEDCLAHRAGRTAQFPAARPRRTLPARRTAMLVATGPGDQLLLERRPAPGIWGGLHAFPELPPAATGDGDGDGDEGGIERAALRAAEAWLVVHGLWHAGATRVEVAGESSHVFSHFRLTITLVHARHCRVAAPVPGPVQLAGPARVADPARVTEPPRVAEPPGVTGSARVAEPAGHGPDPGGWPEGLRWCSPAELATLGIAAPVRAHLAARSAARSVTGPDVGSGEDNRA